MSAAPEEPHIQFSRLQDLRVDHFGCALISTKLVGPPERRLVPLLVTGGSAGDG